MTLRWFAGLPMLAAAGCGYSTQEYRSVAAPDGAYVATFYRTYRSAAVAPNHLRVSVRARGAPLAPDAFAFEMRGGCGVALRWAGPRRLVIAYPAGALVVRADTSAGPVAVAAVAEPMPAEARTC